MPLNLPLMQNNITRVDLDAVIVFLRGEDPILTQSTNVQSFEEEWSEWLGVKHSVFVNSGSSANQLTMAALRLRFPEGGEVIVPPLTWVSDIAAVLQAGLHPGVCRYRSHPFGDGYEADSPCFKRENKSGFSDACAGFQCTDR